MSNQEPFAIGKALYEAGVMHAYKSLFLPKTLIQFGVVLPFQIPATEDATYTFEDDGASANTYHFSTFTVPHYIPSGAYAAQETYQDKKALTRVEMVRALGEQLTLPDDMTLLLSSHFDRLLMKLSELIVGYLIYSKDRDVYRVRREMLQPGCLYRIIKLDDPSPWDTSITGLFTLHTNMNYIREPLTHDEVLQGFLYGQALTTDNNPFILAEEVMMDAGRYFKQGFYRESVLFIQMSIENLLNILFIQLLLHEGKTKLEAESELENTAFKMRVQNQFHPRLGGKWNLLDIHTKAGRWWQNTYLLRNRIAHGNYFPSYEEVSQAMDSAIDFRVYVVDLIHSKKKKYKDIAELIRKAKKG